MLPRGLRNKIKSMVNNDKAQGNFIITLLANIIKNVYHFGSLKFKMGTLFNKTCFAEIIPCIFDIWVSYDFILIIFTENRMLTATDAEAYSETCQTSKMELFAKIFYPS